MVNESKRSLGLAWGIAFLSLIYAELNTPPTHNSFTNFLDAMTEDGPAACFGFLTGATVMYYAHHARDEEEATRARHRIVTLAAFCLTSGMLLNSIQVAIVPITVTIGIVALLALPLSRLNNLALLLALLVSTLLSTLIHTVFILEFPAGGPYPILAWVAYGICGILIYRVLMGRRVYVYILFWTGVLVGMLGILTVLPNYLPELFGISYDMGTYYRANPQTTSIRFLSSTAHSGGLINVVGNFAAGTYLLSACFVLQRFRFLEPIVSAGRLTLSIYPFYVLISAIFMAGFPGFSAELNSALSSPSVSVNRKELDWETFSEWVDNSNSWDDLQIHSQQFYGSDGTSLIDKNKTENIERSSFQWSYPFSVLAVLIISTLWLRRFPEGLIEMLLFRRRQSS